MGTSLQFRVVARFPDERFVEIQQEDPDRFHPAALVGLE
jgi:hypothetical protein